MRQDPDFLECKGAAEATAEALQLTDGLTRPLVVALAGNPNSGKTTLFNALTGLRYKVANYPGVTVERREGLCDTLDGVPVCLVDLPGLYTFSDFSMDEQVASCALLGELRGYALPDAVITVVDAANLERNLFLTSQLIDLGVPLLVVLTMSDLAAKRGITVRSELLARELDAPVVTVVASQGKGIAQLKSELQNLLRSRHTPQTRWQWLPPDSAYLPCARTAGRAAAGTDSSPGKEFVSGAALLSGRCTPAATVTQAAVEAERAKLTALGIDPVSFEPRLRYAWIRNVALRSCAVQSPGNDHFQDKLDRLLLHRVWGVVVFLGVMALIFQAVFLGAAPLMSLVNQGVESLGHFVGGALSPGPLRSLLVDGVIAGAGSVLVFIPQIAMLFFLLGIFEDCGYLARAACISDKLMRRIGLQGRSFIPLLSAFACAVPGVMAARMIPTRKERLITIMIAPFMSCSARLPIYTLLIAAFIPQAYFMGFLSLQGLVMAGLYLAGLLGAVLAAWLLRKGLRHSEASLFVMELPPLRRPLLRTVLMGVWDRVRVFLRSAGTTIVACSVVLWFLASYPSGQIQNSYLGRVGQVIEPAVRPLGFNWEIGVGVLSSFAAREVFVSTLATIYNLADEHDDARSLLTFLQQKHASGSFTLPTALAVLVFYVFACQCLPTLIACRREAGAWRWSLLMFIYMGVFAYTAAFVTFRVSSFLTS